jgi:hypothetical protein
LDGSGTPTDLFAGEVTPSFVALLRAPAASAAPAISGSGALGQPLSCSQGSWAPDLLGALLYRAPRDLGYQWRRDGTDIAGATAPSYTPLAPGSYSCRVTASNRAGSTGQTSDAVAVAEPPQPPGPVAPAPSPPAGPEIAELRLAARCVRPTRSGRVRVRMSLELARPGPVQVRIDRGVGTKARSSCPPPRRGRRFTGRFRTVATLRRVPTQPAAAAAVGRRLTLDLRLTPGLYRITVRAVLDGNRLSRSVRRYLRVLGR